MAPTCLLIDTDPGVDDILAILLALSSRPEEVEVALISVTYGNVPLQKCMRNLVTLFKVLEEEQAWRARQGKAPLYATMPANKPIFYDQDGLHGVHDKLPHFSMSDDSWKALFSPELTTTTRRPNDQSNTPNTSKYFHRSQKPANKEILHILRETPKDTIIIVALGPLTTLALAADEDPETFLKVKEVVVMGGAIDVKGNASPVVEFNIYADAIAAARVFALTSPDPRGTMPTRSALPPYLPERLSGRLRLTLVPLNITRCHVLSRQVFGEIVTPSVEAGSPLATFVDGFMRGMFDWIEAVKPRHGEPVFPLFDPLAVWYAMTSSGSAWEVTEKLDIRVETCGEWTKGMLILDRRSLVRPSQTNVRAIEAGPEEWSGVRAGNRVNRIVRAPEGICLAKHMMHRIFD
ncbi:Inosine/uridine-preferring nucleoside hydrolase domain-containing protein [Aspergillus bertholletiae]|uniref:Inosine/uridine-preferring nucleoside hydrolase domain-containing protein n=1 Tax=Aspergillus bertholletiae TaxID=1226010 RepID=A0A5N7BPF6_9EURO|nr:Inosine/uridine-preferring nucleoside hydrolase domain-containing protein [Aspergillus bertholletiae]